VTIANERGGPDNITVIAARFTGGGLAPAGSDDAVGYVPLRRTSGDSPAFSLEALLQRPAQPDADDAGFADPAENGEAAGSPDANRRDDLHPLIIYGILAAAVIGVVIILAQRTF
jgi:hypothetical protein